MGVRVVRGLALVDAVHVGGRGFVSFSGPDCNGQWRDVLVPARLSVAEAAKREGLVDVYMSVAQFCGGYRRTADRVLSFGATAADIDDHTGSPCDPDRMWREVRAFLEQDGVPLPSAVVASGRGLHLWWTYSRCIPGIAAPRWRALQSALAGKLSRLGADPSWVDAARVLRLPDTVNSKTGTEAEIIFFSTEQFDFEELFAAAAPIARRELGATKGG